MFRRILLNRLCLAIALLALPTMACDLSSLTTLAAKTATPPTAIAPVNIITNAVTSKAVKGVTFDPSGITDAFPADQNIFHAVITLSGAPNNTAVKVAWLAEDDTLIGEFEVKADGSRNLDFTFKPDAGRLPGGNYKAEIYLNGNLERTLNFSVQNPPAQSTAAPKPTSAPVQPTAAPKPTSAPAPTTRPAPKSSGYINEVVVAQDVTGDTKEPSNPTVVFKTSATFHAVVRTQNAPANTRYKASWYATDIGSVAEPNTLIDETELATDGSRNIDFTLAPKTAWPVGSYRIEISVNGVLDTVKNFSVK